MPKPKINRKEWRTLPIDQWNTLTFHAYFADMNREFYGVDYVPMRNWRFEQGVLKNAIAAHGPEVLRAAFDQIFREYRPTREFPLLTAGFAVAYRINAVIPRIQAQKAEVEAIVQSATDIDVDAVQAWL